MVIMTKRKNMSIMELAYQILDEEGKALSFIELYDKICAEKEISEEEKLENISQIYTDFITSGKFIYVGDDEWDIKGRQIIELWDKDGAYYDEYPDYEEELSLYDGGKEVDEYSIPNFDEEEDEEESQYEDDFDEEDIIDDDSKYDDFDDKEEDYIEDEKDLLFEEELEEEVEDFDEDEEEEEFNDEEYNEYMDDYEEMYED
ncbi:MAG: DNA-directed RNA polymerase subunit delta [Tenericutes bacterium 4572_104]|nr:MAG: DNA-directed RNA polymerase subunit delta [Tenericutes bacterium 4572_104]